MKRTFFYLLLCAVCLGVNAKKVKQVLALTRNEKIKGVHTIVEPVR